MVDQQGGTAVAILETPFQLLSFTEAHVDGVVNREATVALRGDLVEPSLLLDLARDRLGADISLVTDPPKRAMRTMIRGADQLVIGDVLSGFVHAVLAVVRPPTTVLLDDGTATVEAAERLGGSGSLQRKMMRSNVRRSVRAAAATAHLRHLTRAGRLTWFTALSAMSDNPIPTVENRFEWSRHVPLPFRVPERPRLVMGSALAVSGLIDVRRYRDWLAEEIRAGSSSFVPHRREDPETRALAVELGAETIDTRGLPIEVVVGGLGADVEFVSLPSTAVITVPQVRRTTKLTCTPIPASWWAPHVTDDVIALYGHVVEAAGRISTAPSSAPRSTGARD